MSDSEPEIDSEVDNSDAESIVDAPASRKPTSREEIEPVESDAEDDDDELLDDEDDDEDEDEDEDEEDEGPLENTINVAQKSQMPFSAMSDDEDEEEDDDEQYLQKFDASTQKKIISEYHPELQSHNYDEVDILSRVVRDTNGNIVDPLHQTLPFITKYEKARILGERAKQINAGGKPMIEVDPTIIDGYLIALKEFDEKAIPFIIKRPLPNGGCEYWKMADLEVLA
jgi:DNA-directed RNA polymerase I, II, and III subunit RPABC2